MSTMDKVKDALHIRRKSKSEEGSAATYSSSGNDAAYEPRDSHDSELEAMTPDERVKYLKEFDHAEKHGEPKKGSFLDRLIAKGNKKTEDELAAEHQLKQQQQQGGVGQTPMQTQMQTQTGGTVIR